MSCGEDCNRDWDENPSKLPSYDCQEMTEEEKQADRLAQLGCEIASNYLVMKKVFGHLSSYDRWRCSGVNQAWRTWNPNICYYEIKVDEGTIDGELPDKINVLITLSKAFEDNDKLLFTSNHSFESASEFLQALPDNSEVRLVDNVFGRYGLDSCYCKLMFGESVQKEYEKFLSEIGRIVSVHRVYMTTSVSNFCLKLAKNFPNLRHLDLSMSYLSWRENEDGDAFTPIPENQLLENLRTLTIEQLHWDHMCLVKLLKAAPNLTGIYKFPIKRVEALVITGKAGLVNSLDYSEDLRSYDDVRGFEMLYDLNMMLSTLKIVSYATHTRILPSFSRILQSSLASLNHLIMNVSPTPINLQVISPLTALKRITFADKFVEGPENEFDRDGPQRYFREGTLLHQLFPSLTHVSIEDVRRLISESAFSDGRWGCKIQSVTLSGPKDLEYIEKIHEMFPNLMSLEFLGPCSSNDFKSLLSAVPAKWPEIQHLSICLDSSLMGPNCAINCSVDSALTGIPDEVLNQLKDSSTRENLSNNEIQDFQQSSTIRQLSTLKSLKIITSGDYLSISKLSHEFGFQFLPYLRLIIEAEECHRGQWIKDVKVNLQPLMYLEIQYCKTVQGNRRRD